MRPLDMDLVDRIFFVAEPVLVLVYIRLGRYLGRPVAWWLVGWAAGVWLAVFIVVVLVLLHRM